MARPPAETPHSRPYGLAWLAPGEAVVISMGRPAVAPWRAAEGPCRGMAGMKVGAHRAVHRRAPWSTRPQALFRTHFVALRRASSRKDEPMRSLANEPMRSLAKVHPADIDQVAAAYAILTSEPVANSKAH